MENSSTDRSNVNSSRVSIKLKLQSSVGGNKIVRYNSDAAYFLMKKYRRECQCARANNAIQHPYKKVKIPWYIWLYREHTLISKGCDSLFQLQTHWLRLTFRVKAKNCLATKFAKFISTVCRQNTARDIYPTNGHCRERVYLRFNKSLRSCRIPDRIFNRIEKDIGRWCLKEERERDNGI